MFKPSRSVRALSVVSLAAMFLATSAVLAAEPKNVILLVGDGMGPQQIKAAGLFAHGKAGSLFMETLPHRAEVVTCPFYTIPASAKSPATWPAEVTDSAAAATAMATGHKVDNGVLSVAIPGDGKPFETVLKMMADQGKMTGLVTSSYLTDATPAAFASHVKNRGGQIEVIAGYLGQYKPNLLMGGAATDKKATFDAAQAAGYTVVKNREELKALKAAPGAHVLGLFGTGPMCYEYDYATKAKNDYDTLPHLSEMATAALDILAAEPKGFFAMIEGGCIDKACHANNLPRAIAETIEFDKTIKIVMDWAAKRNDTLVLIVADHETGGLQVTKDNGEGKLPGVKWTTGSSHSGANVILFAAGPGSEKVAGTLDNTDIFRLMSGTFTSPTVYRPNFAEEKNPHKAVAEVPAGAK